MEKGIFFRRDRLIKAYLDADDEDDYGYLSVSNEIF
jgi:hypothetical protein